MLNPNATVFAPLPEWWIDVTSGAQVIVCEHDRARHALHDFWQRNHRPGFGGGPVIPGWEDPESTVHKGFAGGVALCAYASVDGTVVAYADAEPLLPDRPFDHVTIALTYWTSAHFRSRGFAKMLATAAAEAVARANPVLPANPDRVRVTVRLGKHSTAGSPLAAARVARAIGLKRPISLGNIPSSELNARLAAFLPQARRRLDAAKGIGVERRSPTGCPAVAAAGDDADDSGSAQTEVMRP